MFYADCQYVPTEIPQRHLGTTLVDPFQLPPLGRSQPRDFNPLAHLELEPEVVEVSSEAADGEGGLPPSRPEDEESDGPKQLAAPCVEEIHKRWLRVYPDKQDLSALLNETFQLGFDSLKNFEKWAMHADLKPYDQVLEPWDYRSYARWEPPAEENERFLNCDDWLQENPSYQHLEADLDWLVTQAFSNIRHQYAALEPVLHEYWTYSQLGLRLLVDERLKNPTVLLPVLLRRLVEQKEEFKDFVPAVKDLGLLRVRFTQLKDALAPQPVQTLAKLQTMLPKMVRSRMEAIRQWMEEQIRSLQTYPTNVDEYVNQLQSLEYIEENYQSVKDRVELNAQIFEILEAFDLPAREDKNSRFIDEVYQLINTLNSAIYDTKDKADRRKDQIKRKVLKKVPKLRAVIDELAGAINHEKFLD